MRTKRRDDLIVVKEARIGNKVVLGGVDLTATGAEINVLHGITSSTVELNKLTGVTADTAELNIMDGVTKTAAQINAAVEGVAGGYKVARGQHTTVAASDDIDTGLTTVISIVATLDDDPVDGCMFVTASIGDQAGAPAAGHALIKTWLNTDADATLAPATTFGKKINWVAFGN